MDNKIKNINEPTNNLKNSWSSIAGKKNLNLYKYNNIKLMRLTSKSYIKLLENYVKYGIIDVDLLDNNNDEKLEIIKDYIEQEDINYIPYQKKNGKVEALNNRNKELNIENINLKIELSRLYKYKNRVIKLEKYINYIENYCDNLLIDNYQDPLFFDKTINEENYSDNDDYIDNDYYNNDDEYFNNDYD